VERQNGELVRLAMRDPLTGVLNRRALFEQFDARWRDAAAAVGPLGCIMVDIDRFKSFNDRYGHAVGDEVIKAVARELGAALRLNDVLGRYGGEEFCIVLSGLDDDTAARVAERMRRALEAKAGGSVRTVTNLSVTASFGVASWRPGMALTPAQLVDRADQALVAAKQAGRNRVLRWDQLGDARPLATSADPAPAANAAATRPRLPGTGHPRFDPTERSDTTVELL
jgi:diguanylate cyclase (GGDEF)-like protein